MYCVLIADNLDISGFSEGFYRLSDKVPTTHMKDLSVVLMSSNKFITISSVGGQVMMLFYLTYGSQRQAFSFVLLM